MDDKNWFVVRTAPLGEFKAVEGLKLRGFDAFVPSEERYRRLSGRCKRKKVVRYPLTPRYVMAGFPSAVPPWQELDQIDAVQGVVSFGGQPSRMRSDVVEAFRNLGPNTGGVQIHKGLRVGDMVEIMSGPFTGWRGPMDAVSKGTASIRLPMLGSDRVVDIAIDLLVPG
jgi:transcription antitermination factor NusG